MTKRLCTDVWLAVMKWHRWQFMSHYLWQFDSDHIHSSIEHLSLLSDSCDSSSMVYEGKLLFQQEAYYLNYYLTVKYKAYWFIQKYIYIYKCGLYGYNILISHINFVQSWILFLFFFFTFILLSNILAWSPKVWGSSKGHTDEHWKHTSICQKLGQTRNKDAD